MTLLLDIITVIYGLTLYRLPRRVRPFRKLSRRKVESERIWNIYLRFQ